MSQINVDTIKSRVGGAPTLGQGVIVSAAATFSGDISATAASFSGNVSIGGTLTYEDVANIDAVGIITARSGVVVSAGGLNVTGISTFANDVRFRGGVVENVSAATTYMNGSAMVVEMDVRNSTVYTYTIPPGANIGIVSFKNMPADIENGTTITLITTQNSAGTGNTTAATGIGTNCTVIPFAAGAAVAGISTRALVGSATTVTLSTNGSDRDFVSFFVHYNGGTNTTASSYKVYVTKNGGFRQGSVGV